MVQRTPLVVNLVIFNPNNPGEILAFESVTRTKTHILQFDAVFDKGFLIFYKDLVNDRLAFWLGKNLPKVKLEEFHTSDKLMMTQSSQGVMIKTYLVSFEQPFQLEECHFGVGPLVCIVYKNIKDVTITGIIRGQYPEYDALLKNKLLEHVASLKK